MILIGLLHHRKHPNSVRKSYAFATVAAAEGAQLLFFSPRKVNFKDKVIDGYVYINGSWQNIRSPFPDVIYNAGSPIKLERSKEIVDKLREEIPFTTNSIGHKMRVYKRIEKEETFKKYLIPSEYIYSTRRFLSFIRRYQKMVFKPVGGHKGQGIAFIEQVRDQYHVLVGTENFLYTKDEIVKFASNRLKEEIHIAQPYIKCMTKTGNAYDVRLHVQKDGTGNWKLLTVYPRIGPTGSIVANINSGGATNYIDPFLKQQFDDEYYNIRRYLEQFSLRLAEHMDDIQMRYFNEEIDELGIDVVLDDLQKIWIIEVNWRPGCPPAFYLELDVVKNMVNYAIFLAKRSTCKDNKAIEQES